MQTDLLSRRNKGNKGNFCHFRDFCGTKKTAGMVCCHAGIKEIREISAISAISAGLKTIYNSIDTVLQDIAGVEINQDSDLQT